MKYIATPAVPSDMSSATPPRIRSRRPSGVSGKGPVPAGTNSPTRPANSSTMPATPGTPKPGMTKISSPISNIPAKIASTSHQLAMPINMPGAISSTNATTVAMPALSEPGLSSCTKTASRKITTSNACTTMFVKRSTSPSDHVGSYRCRCIAPKCALRSASESIGRNLVVPSTTSVSLFASP